MQTPAPSSPARSNIPRRVTALGKPRQPVLGQRLPRRREGHELAHRGANAWIVIEGTHPNADGLRVARVRAEHRRAALAAEPLLAAAFRFPQSQTVPARDDSERARSRMRLCRSGRSASPLAPLAVAVARA